jgi:hypothetical protein
MCVFKILLLLLLYGKAEIFLNKKRKLRERKIGDASEKSAECDFSYYKYKEMKRSCDVIFQGSLYDHKN